jgi:hypothetical protein
MLDMKIISVSVSASDYEAFRRAAQAQHRPIAQLIRDAMALYRATELQERTPLTDVAVLPGHRPRGPLPTRAELYDEMFGDAPGDLDPPS